MSPLRELYDKVSGRSPLWTPLHLHHRALGRYVEAQAPRVLDLVGASQVRVLDLGCGDMPYRASFAGDPRVACYDGADIPGSGSVGTIDIDPVTQSIAAATGSYDLIVSFQVFEHCSDPMTLLRECRRVLRPGGVIFLTLPFFFEYHAVPRDFRRWTHEGIAEDLTLAGYRDAAAEPIETDLESLLVVNELYLSRHWGYVMTKGLFAGLNVLGRLADRLRPSHRHRLIPLTLGVTARAGLSE